MSREWFSLYFTVFISQPDQIKLTESTQEASVKTVKNKRNGYFKKEKEKIGKKLNEQSNKFVI